MQGALIGDEDIVSFIKMENHSKLARKSDFSVWAAVISATTMRAEVMQRTHSPFV